MDILILERVDIDPAINIGIMKYIVDGFVRLVEAAVVQGRNNWELGGLLHDWPTVQHTPV
jgi:hypothetical protein